MSQITLYHRRSTEKTLKTPQQRGEWREFNNLYVGRLYPFFFTFLALPSLLPVNKNARDQNWMSDWFYLLCPGRVPVPVRCDPTKSAAQSWSSRHVLRQRYDATRGQLWFGLGFTSNAFVFHWFFRFRSSVFPYFLQFLLSSFSSFSFIHCILFSFFLRVSFSFLVAGQI